MPTTIIDLPTLELLARLEAALAEAEENNRRLRGRLDELEGDGAWK